LSVPKYAITLAKAKIKAQINANGKNANGKKYT